MIKHIIIVVVAILLVISKNSAIAGEQKLTFEDLESGSTLSTQYQLMGIEFVPNAYSGRGNSSSGADWATNTSLTVTDGSALEPDVEFSGSALISGKFIRPFDEWLLENGDPSFGINFAAPVIKISMDFAGLSTDPNAMLDTRIFAFNGELLLGEIGGTGATGSQFTLSFEAPAISRIIVAPGSFNSWVAIDNLTFTSQVPEPRTGALLLAGLGAILTIASRRSGSRSQSD